VQGPGPVHAEDVHGSAGGPGLLALRGWLGEKGREEAMSGKHLEGRTGKYTLCGGKLRDLDRYTQVTYPERDGIQVRLCRGCAAQIPRHPIRRLFHR